jgi:hypothetical protein
MASPGRRSKHNEKRDRKGVKRASREKSREATKRERAGQARKRRRAERAQRAAKNRPEQQPVADEIVDAYRATLADA